MPLVFVHGVNVRDSDPFFAESQKQRDSFFRQYALKALVPGWRDVLILNPDRGNFAVKFAWNHASFPSDRFEHFGASDITPLLLMARTLGSRTVDPDTVLVEIGRKSMADAVDLLWSLSTETMDDDPERAMALAELSERATSYAQETPQPAWLATVNNNDEFLVELADAVEARALPAAGAIPSPVESFGFGDLFAPIFDAGERVRNLASQFTPLSIFTNLRRSLNAEVTEFVGDIFVYLQKREGEENPGDIVKAVAGAIERACNSISPADPRVIVVAHSMGANIVYDILTHFRPDLKVDALVTVGAQVALFEEMKLYKESDPALPANVEIDRVKKPQNVQHWVNVFDPYDILAYATSKVFAETHDFSFDTDETVFAAHGAYFSTPNFHRRMAVRLDEVWNAPVP